jgi:hypothetical protein
MLSKLATTYKMTFMYLLVIIHINNQSTLYKVNGEINILESVCLSMLKSRVQASCLHTSGFFSFLLSFFCNFLWGFFRRLFCWARVLGSEPILGSFIELFSANAFGLCVEDAVFVQNSKC